MKATKPFSNRSSRQAAAFAVKKSGEHDQVLRIVVNTLRHVGLVHVNEHDDQVTIGANADAPRDLFARDVLGRLRWLFRGV